MKIIKIMKIIPEKEEILRNWMNQLNNERNNEAIESLKRENISRESLYFFQFTDRKYLIFFAESDGEILEADTSLLINKEHQKILSETIERVICLPECLYDFKLP